MVEEEELLEYRVFHVLPASLQPIDQHQHLTTTVSDDVNVVRRLAVRYNDLAAAEVVRVALAGVVEKLPPGPSLEPGTGGEVLDVPGNLPEE